MNHICEMLKHVKTVLRWQAGEVLDLLEARDPSEVVPCAFGKKNRGGFHEGNHEETEEKPKKKKT